jgi:hypothetical protein
VECSAERFSKEKGGCAPQKLWKAGLCAKITLPCPNMGARIFVTLVANMSKRAIRIAPPSEAGQHNNAAGFLTVGQLLERVPISRRTLANHRRKGLIPWINLGGRVLFDWPSVRTALLRQQRASE